MEKTMVSRGGFYWIIDNNGMVVKREDLHLAVDDLRFEIGNCFSTKEEAEAMAEKIRKVLKGADVIEMPSEEEMKDKAIDIAMNICGDDYWRDCEEAVNRATEWLKSKIVK